MSVTWCASRSASSRPIAEPGDSAAELLRRADLAMYAAKARGKGLFGIFEPSTCDDGLVTAAIA
jgi:predicted signal transduction protein with EAL and GGDEF domain